MGFVFLPIVTVGTSDWGRSLYYTVMFAFSARPHFSGVVYAISYYCLVGVASVCFLSSFLRKKTAFGFAFSLLSLIGAAYVLFYAMHPFAFGQRYGDKVQDFRINPIGMGFVVPFLIAAAIALILSIIVLAHPLPEKEIEEEEPGVKKPSKLKILAMATKRVNSPDFIGTLYTDFGTAEQGRFLNLTKEGGLVLYSAKAADVTLSETDVTEVVYESKGSWYENGSNEKIDVTVRLAFADGRVGRLKAPIARFKAGLDQEPVITQDNLNVALKRLGSSLSFSFEPYVYEVQIKGAGVKKGKIVSESDELFLAELKRNYPQGGTVLVPERMRGMKF